MRRAASRLVIRQPKFFPRGGRQFTSFKSGFQNLQNCHNNSSNFKFFNNNFDRREYLASSKMTQRLDTEKFLKQDDVTTNMVIDYFAENEDFQKVAKAEMKLVTDRDELDVEKLKEGIQRSLDSGAIKDDFELEKVTTVNVSGKSADTVADEIIKAAGVTSGVLVLTGLSGTGKGTTVAKMSKKLDNAVTWSNGNLFRSITLLANAYCAKNKMEFSEDMLTPERLQEFMSYLSFGKREDAGGKWDIHIKSDDLDIDKYVSDVQGTDLKAADISKNIPKVAAYTQGHVIMFASAAADQVNFDF